MTVDNSEQKQAEKPKRGQLARFIFCKLVYIKLTQQTTGLPIEEMKVKATDRSEWRHAVEDKLTIFKYI